MKEQYLSDIRENQNHIPYENELETLNRIKSIYNTARKGNIGNQVAINLMNHLINMFHNHNAIPDCIEYYNEYAKKHIKEISIIISLNNNLRFGIAQKIFNLFLKDLWAWNILTQEQERVLHFPLDRIILSYLRNNPWSAWTKVFTTIGNYDNTFSEYLSIQSVLKSQLDFYHFNFPLELEQYLWHKFQ